MNVHGTLRMISLEIMPITIDWDEPCFSFFPEQKRPKHPHSGDGKHRETDVNSTIHL